MDPREDRASGLRLRQKWEEELAQKEGEGISYWKGELEKILARQPDSLRTLQMDLQSLVKRMQNLIRVLKAPGSEPIRGQPFGTCPQPCSSGLKKRAKRG